MKGYKHYDPTEDDPYLIPGSTCLINLLFLGWINKIHPFREGNGRAQRILLDQLALLHGYVIEWSGMSGDAMALACRESRTIDKNSSRLRKLIALHTLQARVA